MPTSRGRILKPLDCVSLPLEDNSVDLVFCSPPYEDARAYGTGPATVGDSWVQWAVPRFMECLRVCKGLVCWVVEGRTRQYRWSATPILLMARLYSAGVCLRKPPVFQRSGIPGSGGPDWLRNDYEFIVCATNETGRLLWSDNTAMGHPPKYAPGGPTSHRTQNGRRVKRKDYSPPKLANPGNVIKCVVGKGHMGSDIAHECQAPFPESLANFFIRSFCPPEGTVLDPFSGSGTTAASAIKVGRSWIASDISREAHDMTRRRVKEARRKCAS